MSAGPDESSPGAPEGSPGDENSNAKALTSPDEFLWLDDARAFTQEAGERDMDRSEIEVASCKNLSAFCEMDSLIRGIGRLVHHACPSQSSTGRSSLCLDSKGMASWPGC